MNGSRPSALWVVVGTLVMLGGWLAAGGVVAAALDLDPQTRLYVASFFGAGTGGLLLGATRGRAGLIEALVAIALLVLSLVSLMLLVLRGLPARELTSMLSTRAWEIAVLAAAGGLAGALAGRRLAGHSGRAGSLLWLGLATLAQLGCVVVGMMPMLIDGAGDGTALLGLLIASLLSGGLVQTVAPRPIKKIVALGAMLTCTILVLAGQHTRPVAELIGPMLLAGGLMAGLASFAALLAWYWWGGWSGAAQPAPATNLPEARVAPEPRD